MTAGDEDSAGCPYLSERDLERIAERAAEKTITKLTTRVYQEVGESVVKKFMWLVGAVVIGLAVWLQSKGFFSG